MAYGGVPPLIRKYISNYMELRSSTDYIQVNCGVPQGDPLSTLLFCWTIDNIVDKLNLEYKTVCFTDDICICHPNLIDH